MATAALARCRVPLRARARAPARAPARQQLKRGPDRVRSRHHGDHDHHRQPPAAHRARRARLQRDRSRVGRVLRLRQRERRRERPQDRLQVPRRRLQPDQDGHGGTPARPAGQRVRDLRRPRHPHPPGGGELPQRAEGPRRVRRVRLRLLERADDGPRDVRLAARLHPRGEDPRPVRGQALRRQEDRLLLPGRRVRHGRRQGARLRDPEVDGGRQADLRPHQRQHRAGGRRAARVRRPGRSSRSPFPRSPRC